MGTRNRNTIAFVHHSGMLQVLLCLFFCACRGEVCHISPYCHLIEGKVLGGKRWECKEARCRPLPTPWCDYRYTQTSKTVSPPKSTNFPSILSFPRIFLIFTESIPLGAGGFPSVAVQVNAPGYIRQSKAGNSSNLIVL